MIKLTSKLPKTFELNGLDHLDPHQLVAEGGSITIVARVRPKKLTEDFDADDDGVTLEMGVVCVEVLDGLAETQALAMLHARRGERTGQAPLALEEGAIRVDPVLADPESMCCIECGADLDVGDHEEDCSEVELVGAKR